MKALTPGAKKGTLAIGATVVIVGAYVLIKKKSSSSSSTSIVSDPNASASVSLVGNPGSTGGNATGTNVGTSSTPDYSLWPGTTNKSGSITYIQGELAGEGSGPLLTQGSTY